MIDDSLYSLTPIQRSELKQLIGLVGASPSLGQIWMLMDQAWEECGCDQQHYEPNHYRDFYNHPVWLLNGIYIEQDPVSMGHRRWITNAVASLGAKQILDFGGGFGTLARLMADRLPSSEIAIYDPHPPAHGLQACRGYPNITFVDTLQPLNYDTLVCTDVLEHVHDPLSMLADMVATVKPGGHLIIANCFAPVILCHLPCTFHLRYFFGWCAEPLGLQQIGRCKGSHAWIYRRRIDGSINLRKSRFREAFAKMLHPFLSCLAIPARPIVQGIRALPFIGAGR